MSSKQLIKSIKWHYIYSGLSYLYGSFIHFHHNEVVFDNPRMASSKELLKFSSRTNYQGDRRSPELPILIPRHTYEMNCILETIPSQRLFLKINFRNRQGEIHHFEIVRESVYQFTCPDDTFTYDIVLVSAGCQRLIFQEILLYDLDGEIQEMNKSVSKCYHQDQIPEDLHFVSSLIKPTR